MSEFADYLMIGGEFDGKVISTHCYRNDDTWQGKGNRPPFQSFCPVYPKAEYAFSAKQDVFVNLADPRGVPEFYYRHFLTKGSYKYWFFYVDAEINPEKLDLDQTFLRLSRFYAKEIR